MKHGPHICYHSAKSYVGKNVNLHLKGGNTLINVAIEGIENKRLLIRGNKPKSKTEFIPLYEVERISVVPIWAQMLQEAS